MLNFDEAIKILSETTGVKHSEEQLNVLKHTGGMCVLACAGSGKTSTLTHLIAKRIMCGDIPEPDKILCTTYSKAGSDEMGDRVKDVLKKAGMYCNVEVKTMHALYYSILRTFGVQKKVCSGIKRIQLINEACRKAELRLEKEDRETLDSLLSFQINNMLSDDALFHSYIYTLDNVSLYEYSRVRMLYNEYKIRDNVIDFDDMQMYMYSLLVSNRNKAVIDYCHNNWQYFFVDEFQDISKIQFEILKVLVTDPNKLVVIGDDDQCIYQWRGANPNIILNICAYYDIAKYVLSTNYRCCGEIVKRAAVGIKNNVKREDKEMIPYKSGGIINIIEHSRNDLYGMSVEAAEHIDECIKSGKYRADEIAVLSRNNKHLAILSSLLFEKNIFCSTQEDMRFTKTQQYNDIKFIMGIAGDTYDYNYVSDNLWKVCVYLGTRGSKFIGEIMKSSACTLKEALCFMVQSCNESYVSKEFLEKYGCRDLKIPKKVSCKLEYQMNQLKPETLGALVTIYKRLAMGDEAKTVSTLMTLYLDSVSFIYKSKDSERFMYALVGRIKKLIEKNGLERAKGILRTEEQYESGMTDVIWEKVTMCTMHSAKGREWRHVILFADDNISFPSFEGISTMMDKNDIKDIIGTVDENRRLHYVAMTRAKEELTIVTDLQDVGMYTLEAFGIETRESGQSTANDAIIACASNGALSNNITSLAICSLADRVINKSSKYFVTGVSKDEDTATDTAECEEPLEA